MPHNKLIFSDLTNLAIIGSGPTALYLLQNILNNSAIFKKEIQSISIFEKDEIIGMGMPYNPKTTDVHNLSNISSEEIPLLNQSFADWLREQTDETLYNLNVKDLPIDDSAVYSRIALGKYFHSQYQILCTSLKECGIPVSEYSSCEVVDILRENEKICVVDSEGKKYDFSTVVIANGHEWEEEDRPESGYFSNPWPIQKILPKNKELYDFAIGTLGSSLSAFDVVTSLSHRHGEFQRKENHLEFIKNPKVPNFKIILHSSNGWLPHLQYEQEEPFRKIYRHFSRNDLLELIDEHGFLSLEEYFDKLCRPALIKAFSKDKLSEIEEKLKDSNFSFRKWVEFMSERHQYINSFEGMKKEMLTAKKSIYKNIPIHWMETLDDLMYSLNYHAELLCAEDHLYLRKEIMSFLMNVIAALPLQSAQILLALYDANCIELKSGYVHIPEDAFQKNYTKIIVESEKGETEEIKYKLFVNCGGEKKLELENYPFPSLVSSKLVRTATASFIHPKDAQKLGELLDAGAIFQNEKGTRLNLSGIDIDSSYRTINQEGIPNPFLFDINFAHTHGLRPYSYGLQACNATSLILVESWLAEITKGNDISEKVETITELYEDNEEL